MGCDVTLVPLYTPIRTDEADVSLDRVFFGGINVYLQQKVPLFRLLPRALDRWLDAPWLLRRLAAGRIEVDARELGELTVSMLQGEHGRQRKEVFRLVDWLERHARPQLVNLSNILIAGCVPHLKARLKVPVLVTLQGDDLFLEQLAAPYKQRALAEIHRLAREIDGFLVFSHYYADFMSGYLKLDRAKFHVVPLGLSLDDFHLPEPAPRERPPTIGYMARICPEKGFHRLVDAFLLLHQRPGLEQVRLRAAGWLGPGDKTFFEKQLERLQAAGVADRFRYDGVVERAEKLELLRSIDVLSVPTEYHEPKGIFVLEAWAAGLPVVQPAHGAFPEMLTATGGGLLVKPNDARRRWPRRWPNFCWIARPPKAWASAAAKGSSRRFRPRDGGANARRLSPHCPRPDFRRAARGGRTRGNGERANDVTCAGDRRCARWANCSRRSAARRSAGGSG